MSDQNNIAISVKNLKKSFKLPHERSNSVKGLFVNMFRGSRRYEKQRVLKGISFDVKKGEFLGIVGRNGGGKSTLLKLLSGIYTPDEGHIEINGKLTPFIELGVGFSPELTGRENVYLNGALFGFDHKQMDAMYDDIVQFAELEKFMDQKLKNYSSGMQVRLAFSIAVRANTDILVLDEVLAVGDANFQQKCLQQFRTFKKEGRTIILVSHSMDMVEKFCDRVVVVSEGKVEFDGDTAHAIEQYQDLNMGDGQVRRHDASKGVSIESVDVIDENGEKVKSVDGNKEFGVRITYEAKHSRQDILAAVKICEAEGQIPVLGFNSNKDDVRIDAHAGKNEITIRFKHHASLSGRFYVLTSLYEDKKKESLLDHFNGTANNSYFMFRNAGGGNDGGLIDLKREWDISKKG